MAIEKPDDLEQLNALVDGELPLADRAAIAARMAAEPDLARAHATLTRLKAEIGSYADAQTAPGLDAPKKTRRRGLVAAVSAAAAILAAAVFAVADLPAHRRIPVAERVAPQAVLASLKLAIPDLSTAGLTLQRVETDGGRPFERLTAIYSGPRGCRLELRVRPVASAPFAPTVATRQHSWSDGELTYELSAFGMPLVRFAMIAEATERQTRVADNREIVQKRLREARSTALPCAG
jgi:anti-sigma factor RsiW